MKNFLEIYLKQTDSFLVNESRRNKNKATVIDSKTLGVWIANTTEKHKVEKLRDEFNEKKNLFNEIKNYVENKDKEATAQ